MFNILASRASKNQTLALLLMMAIICAGCHGCQESKPGRVALVDLSLVGQEIGALKRIQNDLSKLDQLLSNTLRQHRLAIEAEEKELKSKTDLDESIRKQKETAILQKKREFSRRLNQGRQKMEARRRELMNSFKEQVVKYAEQIAQQEGYSLVMTFDSHSPTERVLVWDNNINLTEMVIKAMRTDGYLPPKKETQTSADKGQNREDGENKPLTTPNPKRLDTTARTNAQNDQN